MTADMPVRQGVSLRLDRTTFSYGEVGLAFDVEFPAGGITAVMGPSGSGKSTLLNLVAGFETPRSGRVLIGGRDFSGASPSERPVSMVFQENNLFAHLDVFRNVGLGISPSLALTSSDRASIADALARTGLAGKDKRLPRELSGGERQRVALARALVRDRPVLLLDEPLHRLDLLRGDMLDLVAAVQGERKMTTLFVTHQPQDARRIAAHVVFLENGTVAASGGAGDFFSANGPAAFRRYAGAIDEG
ncbi:ATP-binding cassette domain-containing protein [Mesorhizobium amorphae]|uniref:thiamine ABC transporter ATP-binding protein n=1 Tax=Mesorhizobium amorphae TaxID=71433 RepID=UPI0011838D25|nr:ATP-binding cassette domain-containing protein [Mesorhizobium amorphae]